MEFKLFRVSEVADTPQQARDTFKWDLCILCQEDTDEQPQNPTKSKQKDCGAGYATLEEDLTHFKETGQLPNTIKISCFDNGSGISNTLLSNKAGWHKSCRDNYNKTKLSCHLKRKVDEDDSTVSKHTGSSTPTPQKEQSSEEAICFFCDKMAPVDKLPPASTLSMDTQVWSAALKLQDSALLTKLCATARDMPALEARYHKACLTSFYNRVRAAERRESKESREPESKIHSLVFAELLDCIEETHRVQATVPVFQLSHLIHLYSRRFEQLGINDYSPHATSFKEKLLVHIPGLKTRRRGREILLTFEGDIVEVINTACWYDSDAICLSKAVKIIQRELFATKSIFDGTCTSACQEDSVPQSRISLINMILEGPSIEDQYANDRNQAALSVSQITKLNIRKRPKKDTVDIKKLPYHFT